MRRFAPTLRMLAAGAVPLPGSAIDPPDAALFTNPQPPRVGCSLGIQMKATDDGESSGDDDDDCDEAAQLLWYAAEVVAVRTIRLEVDDVDRQEAEAAAASAAAAAAAASGRANARGKA